jgi:hypothetical protein
MNSRVKHFKNIYGKTERNRDFRSVQKGKKVSERCDYGIPVVAFERKLDKFGEQLPNNDFEWIIRVFPTHSLPNIENKIRTAHTDLFVAPNEITFSFRKTCTKICRIPYEVHCGLFASLSPDISLH